MLLSADGGAAREPRSGAFSFGPESSIGFLVCEAAVRDHMLPL